MNKKKIIIISVSAAAAVALLILGAILILKNAFKGDTSSEQSAGETVITVADTEGTCGKKIRVPVKISGNPGFMAAMLEFKYDTSSLKYVTYYKGDFLTDYTFEDDDGTLKFLGVEDNDVSNDGVLFELEFELTEDAEASEITIEVGSGTALCNFNEETLTFDVNSGKITVK